MTENTEVTEIGESAESAGELNSEAEITPLHAVPDFKLPVFEGPLDLMLTLIQKDRKSVV